MCHFSLQSINGGSLTLMLIHLHDRYVNSMMSHGPRNHCHLHKGQSETQQTLSIISKEFWGEQSGQKMGQADFGGGLVLERVPKFTSWVI